MNLEKLFLGLGGTISGLAAHTCWCKGVNVVLWAWCLWSDMEWKLFSLCIEELGRNPLLPAVWPVAMVTVSWCQEPTDVIAVKFTNIPQMPWESLSWGRTQRTSYFSVYGLSFVEFSWFLTSCVILMWGRSFAICLRFRWNLWRLCFCSHLITITMQAANFCTIWIFEAYGALLINCATCNCDSSRFSSSKLLKRFMLLFAT